MVHYLHTKSNPFEERNVKTTLCSKKSVCVFCNVRTLSAMTHRPTPSIGDMLLPRVFRRQLTTVEWIAGFDPINVREEKEDTLSKQTKPNRLELLTSSFLS